MSLHTIPVPGLTSYDMEQRACNRAQTGMTAQGSIRGSSSCAVDRGPTKCNEVEGGDYSRLLWPIAACFNQFLQVGGSHECVAVQ